MTFLPLYSSLSRDRLYSLFLNYYLRVSGPFEKTMSINHVGISVADINREREFYIAALKPLGYKLVMNMRDQVLGFGGLCGPDFWLASVEAPYADGSDVRHGDANSEERDKTAQEKREPTNRMHIAFSASNRQQVREFHEAAM